MTKAWMNMFTPVAAGVTKKTADAHPLPAMTNMYQESSKTRQNQFHGNPRLNGAWSNGTFTAENPVLDMFNKILNSGKGLVDLSAVWQELAAKGPFMSRDEIQKFLEENNADLEKLFKDLAGLFVPDKLRPLVDNAVELVKQYEPAAKYFARSWLEQGLKNAEDFKKIMEGDATDHSGFYKRLSKAYNESYGQFFSAAGISLTSEQNEVILEQFDSFFKMLISLAELMYLTAEVTQENMVTVVEAYQKNITAGNQSQSLKEFYDLWVRINEESFVKVFMTPQFSFVFSEFAKQSYDFKVNFDKVLEQILGWTPFPKNSEMADYYKEIDELLKKEQQHSKKIEEMSRQMDALHGVRDEMVALRAVVEKLAKPGKA
ncbi:MAG: hypothetical protein LBQ51_02380 [Desulfovibrio sp.]|nr:hypothetical protein [Desulfovibrio sp.]